MKCVILAVLAILSMSLGVQAEENTKVFAEGWVSLVQYYPDSEDWEAGRLRLFTEVEHISSAGAWVAHLQNEFNFSVPADDAYGQNFVGWRPASWNRLDFIVDLRYTQEDLQSLRFGIYDRNIPKWFGAQRGYFTLTAGQDDLNLILQPAFEILSSDNGSLLRIEPLINSAYAWDSSQICLYCELYVCGPSVLGPLRPHLGVEVLSEDIGEDAPAATRIVAGFVLGHDFQ